MGSWKWTARYAVVLVVAVLLGAAIAELSVFKQTMLGTPKLSASAAARFLGYGGALVIFWILGRRVAQQLCASESHRRAVGFLVLPLVTLIVLSAGYDVVLAILRPFLSATAKVNKGIRDTLRNEPERFMAYNTTTGLAGLTASYLTLSAAGWATCLGFECIVHNGANAADFALYWSQTTATSAATISRLAGSYLEYSTVV